MNKRVYEHECPECGHLLRNNVVWINCLDCKEGHYHVIAEYPAGL